MLNEAIQQHDHNDSSQSGLTRLLRTIRLPWRRTERLNISKITDQLFVGGQFKPEQWPAIYNLGIRAVLNLQAEHIDDFVAPFPSRTMRIMIPDFHAPTMDQLHEGVTFIRTAHEANEPALIHCFAGAGRAPLVTTAYLIASGLNARDAMTTIRRARPIVSLTQPQIDRLYEWERQHTER